MLKPVTPELFKAEFETDAVPETTDHRPVPVTATFAFNVAEEAHTVCDGPALETVGETSLITVTVLLEDGQVPLEIVQTKRLMPMLKPLTTLPGEEGLVTVDVPVETDQRPVPIVGVFPESVAEDVHKL